ncbi:MAG: glycosyltransferase [Flavobacteriales bacterium]|nr:glycosyltransferase [Flavobacteriales bacterium]
MPSPPDYGGVIDVYFKAKALAALGVRVHLHCFAYGRPPAADLTGFCEAVHYYPRRTGKHQLLSSQPYVVISRRSEEMMHRLQQDRHPILFEGLHSCHNLGDPRLAERKRMVRAHNVEHDYYAALAKAEPGAFRRTYFLNEARKLQRFENVLSHAHHVLAISPKDERHFAARHPHVLHIPAFHPGEWVEVPAGLGDFALYHGALGVPENDRAALFLVREVFRDLGVKLIIAGSTPSDNLRREVARTPNVELRADIPTEEIHRLVRTAQVNVLPTFQATGIKLKLLLCLFTGRHVVCTPRMVEGTGLGDLCHIHRDAQSMRLSILANMARPVEGAALEARQRILEERFSNRRNAQRILALLDR